MAKKQEKEIERWVTVNGARVPIFKDGSIGGPKALRDKVKAVVKEKSSDGKSLKDMSATDIGKEYLTATGERKKTLLKELHDRGYRRNKDGSWGKKESDKSGVTRKDVEELTKKKDKVSKTAKLDSKPITKKEVEEYKKNNPFKKSDSTEKVDNITGKNVKWLDYNIKQQGLGMESADMEDIKRNAKFMNGEKVSLYDKAGNEYRGTFNVYNDGGMEVVDIKKEWYNRKPDDTSSTGVKYDRPKTSKQIDKDFDTKEKQIARNQAEKEKLNGKKEPTEEEMRAYLKERGQERFVKELNPNQTEEGYQQALRYVYDQNTLSKEEFKKKYFTEKSDKKEKTVAPKKETKSPMARAYEMTESELRAYVKKNNLTKSYNMMMNTRPGAYGYSKQLQVLRDLVADDMARRKKK